MADYTNNACDCLIDSSHLIERQHQRNEMLDKINVDTDVCIDAFIFSFTNAE